MASLRQDKNDRKPVAISEKPCISTDKDENDLSWTKSFILRVLHRKEGFSG